MPKSTLVPFDKNRFTLSLVSDISVQHVASKSLGSAYGESMQDLSIPEQEAVTVVETFAVRAGSEIGRAHV